MLKKLARWILREELEIEHKRLDEQYTNQLTRLRDLYSSNIANLKEQHMKEMMILGDKK